jgi:O-acetyl-ADP-ribose deacetylase (regulator of RNase III)
MIIKVTGDILLSDAQAIAQGIAPHDHFNQGLALSLRDQFPAMAKDFRHYCHQNNPKAGGAWLWAGPERVIVNLMTQEPAPDEKAHPGKASLKNVGHALKALRKIVEAEKLTSIALPRLASGVGGLAWADVEPLIREHLEGLDATVIIYETYAHGVKAKENLEKAA